jgi:hypothetical protein
LSLDDPTTLQADLERYGTARQIFVDWLLSHLAAGIDYMLIHRKVGPRGQKTDCPNRGDATNPRCETCGGKATLCKPGSEKLCGLLQLRPRFKRDIESWEMLGGESGLVTLVCELTTAAGVVVAEGRGARHRDQDFGDVNKTIKMVQKSAQVDAVLRCAGLSELFSQDLEDLPAAARDADEPDPFAAPRRTEPAAAPCGPVQGELVDQLQRSVTATAAARRTVAADEAPPRDALSKPRIGRLYALLHDAISGADVPDDQHTVVFERARDWLTQWVATTQGRPTIAACSYRAYDELCAQIPAAVESALQGGARPAPRLVRIRPAGPRRPLH